MLPSISFEVAQGLGIHFRRSHSDLYKAKISLDFAERIHNRPLGRYILVTAINPTPLGEGKDNNLGWIEAWPVPVGPTAAVTLRQPSLGPVFGIKGGGTGGGRAQVWPMEDINLHFTGDAHAVSASHNLLSAFVDNHLFHGNALKLDPHRIRWPRDIGCERSDAPTSCSVRRQGRGRGAVYRYQTSEIMAVLALATDHTDLHQRLGPESFISPDEAGR